ncbi:transketolase [Kitasatospora aureofaciens]|uniref:transketolase n=1 Tax=Kitasatospora aureofaciens TaxID=1894 RepID=UPI0036F4A238
MNNRHPVHLVDAPLDPWQLPLIEKKASFSRLEASRLSADSTTLLASSAEILATLYYGVLRIRHADPEWPDRDRFAFGGRTTAAALAPLLADLGFCPRSHLDRNPQLVLGFEGQPGPIRLPGVDFGSGSADVALPVGVGMATAACLAGRQYRTFVLLDENQWQEGRMWEAALVAGRHALGNLIAIVNHSKQSPHEGLVDTDSPERCADKWAHFGWDVFHVDGHDVTALLPLLRGLQLAHRSAPAVVIARTDEAFSHERHPLGNLRDAASAPSDGIVDCRPG